MNLPTTGRKSRELADNKTRSDCTIAFEDGSKTAEILIP
jgi:hypothetical protein